MKIKLACIDKIWTSQTPYGELTLCDVILQRLFPNIQQKNEITLSISNRQRKGFLPVILNKPYYEHFLTHGFWCWAAPTLQEPVKSVDSYFGGTVGIDETITRILQALKHPCRPKKSQRIKVWINVT